MNVQGYVDNRTPMVVRCACVDDANGHEQLVTVAKLTWAVSDTGTVRLENPPSPIRFVPQQVEGEGTSLLRPSDLVQFKPGTDVALVGTATPGHGGKATSLDVTLRVGDGDSLRVDKTLRVYGPRLWQQGVTGVRPGPPGTLAPTPMVYENTYGGWDDSDPKNILIENRNPAGTGLVTDAASLVGTAAPQIEDLRHPLSSRKPGPGGFGPIPSNWMPLLSFAGTHDETWKRTRSPIHPVDFKPRFNGCAPDDQHCSPPLNGNEMFEVIGMMAGRPWRFQLPLFRPVFAAKHRDNPDYQPLATHLDTVIIDADAMLVELTWRASVRLPVVPQLLESVRVGSTDALPPAVHEQVMDVGREPIDPERDASGEPTQAAEPTQGGVEAQ